MQPHHPADWFRHGDLTDAANQYRTVIAAPTLVAQGVPVPGDGRDWLAVLDIAMEAAGAHTFTIVVYGWKPAINIVLAAGVAPTAIPPAHASGVGWSNLGEIAVTGVVAGTHSRESHQLQGVTAYTRLYARATTVVGGPSIWTDFGFSRHKE